MKPTSLVLAVTLLCSSPPVLAEPAGPFQATGLKVGEVTDTTAIVWTRLTLRPERNPADGPIVKISQEKDKKDKKQPNKKQRITHTVVEYPAGATVSDLRDAAPGTDGHVRVNYKPLGSTQGRQTDWRRVDPERDFIRQFTLTGLQPDTRYEVKIETRGAGDGAPGQSLTGRFRTAAAADDPARVVFTVSTGQRYTDRDGPEGFNIYPAMLKLDRSLFVHSGDIVFYVKLA